MIRVPTLQFLCKPKSKPVSATSDVITVGYMKIRCPICNYIKNLKLAVPKGNEEDNAVLIDEEIFETFYNQQFVTLAENHNCTAKPKTLIKMDIVSIELTDACVINIPDLI